MAGIILWRQTLKILAIDPGRHGAICIATSAQDINPTIVPLPQRNKLVDVCALQDLLIQHAPELVAIEQQMALSAQRGQALIMQNYGRMTATIELCGVNYTEHAPKSWQAYHGISGDKAEHIAKAEALGIVVPYATTATGKPSKKKWHDAADAYLLAIAAYVLPPF
jgi:Holliday junction resolvasome RuvABC endonuclease subunit